MGKSFKISFKDIHTDCTGEKSTAHSCSWFLHVPTPRAGTTPTVPHTFFKCLTVPRHRDCLHGAHHRTTGVRPPVTEHRRSDPPAPGQVLNPLGLLSPPSLAPSGHWGNSSCPSALVASCGSSLLRPPSQTIPEPAFPQWRITRWWFARLVPLPLVRTSLW